MRSAPLALVLLGVSGAARADGPLDLASPVADDGATAVIVNPAGLARRDTTRVQVGVAIVDDDASYDAGGGAPVVIARGASQVAPVVGAQMHLGPLVVGVGYFDEVVFARGFAAPEVGQPAADVDRLFPGRYAGLAAAERVHTLAAGASWRANDWLAIGGALSLSRVSLDETKRIWAGFAGRDPLGDASRDVIVRVSGVGYAPGASAGVLVAPIDAPIELATSVSWSAGASLGGDAIGTAGSPTAGPQVRGTGAATATDAQPLVIRTGARWLAERWIAEVGGALSFYPEDPEIAWSIANLTIVDDITQKAAPLTQLASQRVRRRHGLMRAALDVEVVPGLIWANVAYSYASAATPTDRLSPAGGDLGGHTLALGAELATGGVTVTLGLARTFTRAVDVGVTQLSLDNPFAAGTAPTGLGVHDEDRDVVGLTFELEK